MEWNILIYTLLGGLLPALLWLWFFLREDALHPEPRKYIAFTFLLGILAIGISLPLEYLTQCGMHVPFAEIVHLTCVSSLGTPVFAWAFIEESAKWLVVAVFILWRKDLVDEPIDAMVYLITIALGFAAFETALFIFEPLTRAAFLETVALTNLRFIGASLVHTLASGIVGFCIALAFYRPLWVKSVALCTGLFFATLLHGIFNHHILKAGGNDATMVFFGVWVGVIVLFLLFERAKRINKYSRT